MEENQMNDPRYVGTSGMLGLKGLNYSNKRALQEAQQIKLNEVLSTPPIVAVGDQIEGLGTSRLDKRVEAVSDLYNLPNFRGEEQSAFWQVVDGVLKGVNLAGTTFLQGTVGLVNGIGNAIATGDLSGFWDNDFNRALKNWNDTVEKALPNYYTDEEQNRPWYQNIFTANFLGDKVIKNLGFTVGAFYSGGIWTKPLSAINAISKLGWAKAVASGLGATVSAVNEGSIEAINNSSDWFNLQKAQLDEQYKKELDGISAFSETTNYDSFKQSIDNNYQKALVDLQEQATKMGNVDFLANIPILLASNIVEFGKLYARGFNTAQKAGNIARKEGKYINQMTKAGARARGAMNALTEGIEEVSQQAASNVAGQLYLPQEGRYDLSMYGAGINPEAENQVIDYMKAISKGINDTMNDGSTWEQFFIGSLTGFMGMPTFGRQNNANAYLGKDKLIGLSGGYFGERNTYLETMRVTDEVVNALNARIQSPKFREYYQGLLKHTKFQNDMDAAAVEGKTKEYKDAEYAQMIADISLFAKAGKLQDYMDMLNEAVDTSDENLESIIKNNTKEDGTGPFIDASGNKMTSTEEGKQQMIQGLKDRQAEMKRAVRQYTKLNESLAAEFGDALTDSEREELVWLNLLSKNQSERAEKIAEESRGLLQQLATRLQGDIANIEQSVSMHDTPLSSEQAKEVEGLQKQINYLNNLQALDNSNLAYNIAKNPGLLITLLKEKGDKLSEDNVQEVRDGIKNLLDIPSLIEDSQKYSEKLNKYLNDPSKLKKDQENERKKVSKRAERRKAANILDSLNSAATFDDIRKTLEDNQESRDVNEDAMNNSTNDVVKQYKELRNRVNAVRSKLSAQTSDTTVIEDANHLLDEVMLTAENPNALDLSSEIFIDPVHLQEREGDTPDGRADRLIKARNIVEKAMQATSNTAAAQTSNIPDDSATQPEQKPQSSGNSGVGTAPAANKPQDSTIRSENGIVFIEQPDGEVGVAVDNTRFESPVQPQADGLIEVKNDQVDDEPPSGNVQEQTWRPAVARYDLKGMTNGVRQLTQNDEWLAVHDYIEKAGGFDFVDSGELAKYAKAGKQIYFGLDPNFKGKWADTVFMYVQKDDGSYMPIGSLFVSKSSTDKFAGQTEFIQYVKDQFVAQPDEAKTSLFISDKTSKVADITRGRIPFSTKQKSLSDALQDSGIDTPQIVVITNNGVEGAPNAEEVADISMKNSKTGKYKYGQAYILVPNAKRGYRGGMTLVYVEPVTITNDILSQNNSIVNTINQGLTMLADAAVAGDRARLGAALGVLSENLLLQNISFVLSRDGSTLYLNRVMTDDSGNIIKKEKDGRFYASTSLLAKIPVSGDIVTAVKNTLTRADVKIRINKNSLSPAYTKLLIDNNLVTTHATQLKSEAAWFKVKPVLPQGQQAATPQQAAQQHAPAKPSVKKGSLLDRAKPTGPIAQTAQSKPSAPEIDSRAPWEKAEQNVGQTGQPVQQSAQVAAKDPTIVKRLINAGYSQEEIDAMTPEEAENESTCL